MSIKYPYYPHTQFPNNIDNFESFLDITQEDFKLIKDYQIAIEDNNIAEAQEILSQIPNASQKLVTSLKLNQLRDAILALEEFYNNDIKTFTNKKQEEWTQYIDRFEYKGDYTSQTYVKNNIVKYGEDLYLNIYKNTTPSNISPTETNYWRKLTVQGMQGNHGELGIFDFAWDSSKKYTPNVIVSYGNSWWVSKQENQGKIPSESTLYWELILTISQTSYPVQPNEPTTQSKGEIWLQVVRTDDYWESQPFYPVQVEEPIGQNDGEVWFEVIRGIV